jgi:hypothetical protein
MLRHKHTGLSFCTTVPFPPVGVGALFVSGGWVFRREPWPLIHNQRQQPTVGLASIARIGKSHMA